MRQPQLVKRVDHGKDKRCPQVNRTTKYYKAGPYFYAQFHLEHPTQHGSRSWLIKTGCGRSIKEATRCLDDKLRGFNWRRMFASVRLSVTVYNFVREKMYEDGFYRRIILKHSLPPIPVDDVTLAGECLTINGGAHIPMDAIGEIWARESSVTDKLTKIMDAPRPLPL